MATKRGLKEIDHQVLRGLRWAWWEYAFQRSRHNNWQVDPSQVQVDHHSVLRVLTRTFPSQWAYGDEQKVSYRLRKLVEYKLAEKDGYRYGSYRPSGSVDPYIKTLNDDVKNEAERKGQEERALVNWFKTTLEKLVPTNEIDVAINRYRRHPEMSLSLSGPLSHLKLVMKLAEMQVQAQDEAAEAYE